MNPFIYISTSRHYFIANLWCEYMLLTSDMYIIYLFVFMLMSVLSFSLVVSLTAYVRLLLCVRAGHSSGGRTLAFESWDQPIEPAWQVHLQFGLFSVLTRGPQLVHQRLCVMCTVPSVGKCI